jgi:beta-glucosidase
MKPQLTDEKSIPAVLKAMTIEEKAGLFGAQTACHLRGYPEYGIPSLYQIDGATGINGSQIVLDYSFTYMNDPELLRMFGYGADIVGQSLKENRQKYKDSKKALEVLDHIGKTKTNDKDFITFPTGTALGASFDPSIAFMTGEHLGEEMRDSHLQACLGPNVDIQRDPLGGRNYEMYGEDPYLVGAVSSQFIKGLQSKGIWACAKHFIANNQEKLRNDENSWIPERALRELYSQGFKAAVEEGQVGMVMSAYDSVNGTFCSYEKKFLTDWLRGEWGFQGIVVSDWGAAFHDYEQALNAGLDVVLPGPLDTSPIVKAYQEGKISLETIDKRAEEILRFVVRTEKLQKEHPYKYDKEAILADLTEAAAAGSVLLKNDGALLPISSSASIAVVGSGSKELIECGSGSTQVVSQLHTDPFHELVKLAGAGKVSDQADKGQVLVYVAKAKGGEGSDRPEMDLDNPDRDEIVKVLLDAKGRGQKTVVILNIAGPIDMRRWISLADAVICIFFPGTQGGKAVAEMLYGLKQPSGRLPMTFPNRYEDTPCYPNYPSEGKQVYYGEGIFVGYRYYDKKKIDVMYPFGYGLSYSSFTQKALKTEFAADLRKDKEVFVPVEVTNCGDKDAYQVIQAYACKKDSKLLAPSQVLVGFKKTLVKAGEKKTVQVPICLAGLASYSIGQEKFVTQLGAYQLNLATSSRDVFQAVILTIDGDNSFAVGPDTLLVDFLKDKEALAKFETVMPGVVSRLEPMKAMIGNYTLDQILTRSIIQQEPDATKAKAIIDHIYAVLKS